ncbi:MAG: hypothetical protein IJZ05_00525 [Rikenellaceae bacterium]|nr:hypothetical protein [Rikenellaceae bacterium]
MKKLKYLALAFIAIGFVSCEDNFTEEPTPVGPEGNLEKMTITLEAGKGASEADETRVYLGSFGSTVTYYWEETDKVGMYALSNTSSMENFEAAINELNSNKNLARFQGDIYVTGQGAQDLFIYWPYNSSNINESEKAVDYLKETGVQVRTLAQQTQSGYNITDGAKDHPSVNSINAYGAAVDLITTDDTGVGAFELQHQTAYLQFELYGENTDGQHAFADGGFKVQGMRVELGKFEGTVSEKNSKLVGTFTPVAIAGNYRYGLPSDYDYSKNKNKVSRDDVVVKSSGTATVVSVTLAEEQELKGPSQKLPVLAVVNPALVTKENVNCIRAVVQLVNEAGTEYVERTRYIDLRSLDALKGGDYYKISYKVVDPAEASAQLDAEGHSNCYIVSYPGTYTFNVNIPGNGQLPFNATYEGLDLAVNENGKFFEASEATNYEVNWLWASGTSFEAANGKVEDVVTVSLNGESGVLVVKPQAANLSGNLVVALTKKESTDIIWSWHIWFGAPKDQHFHFPNTRPSIPINNEDWYMLDRNIGAETNDISNVRSYGLYYQLGRHTPFITPKEDGEWTTTNQLTNYVNSKFGKSWGYGTLTVANSYVNPMTINNGHTIGTSATSNIFTYGWVTSDQPATANSKTLFDPCPLGYKLPLTREWDNLKNNEFEAASPAATGSGVFGYAAPYSETDYTNYSSLDTDTYPDVAAILNSRVDNGDYFVHSDNGRTYTTTALAGSSASTPLITTFPNSGTIGYRIVNYTYWGSVSSDTFYEDANDVGSKIILWSAGRLEGTSYQAYAFGAKTSGDFDYTDSNAGLDWHCYMPWHRSETIYNSPFGNLGSLNLVPAAPARCIKEYNDNVEQ